MTDEELTNELTQKAKESYKIYSDDNHVDTYEGYQYIDGYCNGYEQGYEDCRHYAHDYYKPKWHDLREDPNDLPKIDGDYLCRIYFYESDNTFPNVLYYDPSCKGFVLEEGGEPFKVKAWCELLKFEE